MKIRSAALLVMSLATITSCGKSQNQSEVREDIYPPDHIVSSKCADTAAVHVCETRYFQGSGLLIEYRGLLVQAPALNAYVRLNGNDGVFAMVPAVNTSPVHDRVFRVLLSDQRKNCRYVPSPRVPAGGYFQCANPTDLEKHLFFLDLARTSQYHRMGPSDCFS